MDAGFNWRKNVWNLDCAPKVKHFSWKVLKRALPVGERLQERHIDVDPKCKRCGCSESITHLFFHGRFAQKVWLLAPLANEVDFRGIIDLQAAWSSLCNQPCLPPTGLTSGTLIPWTLWSIWKARNKFVFEGFSASPEETLSSAIKLAREWKDNAKAEPTKILPRVRQEFSAPSGVRVVRSDAAWRSTENAAGLGWTFLPSMPDMNYQKSVQHVTSPLMAEGLALREAVRTCQRLELGSVRFESDSALLIKCLNAELDISELHSVVSDVRAIVSAFDYVSFGWISREKNVVDDVLAKNALLVVEHLVVVDALIAPN